MYEYNLVTSDFSGNLSVPEKTLRLEALKSFYLAEIKNVTVKKSGEELELRWKYPNQENYSFVIYKTASDGVLETYKRLEGENTLKLKYDEGETYKFAVKAESKDGRESILSKMVSLK